MFRSIFKLMIIAAISLTFLVACDTNQGSKGEKAEMQKELAALKEKIDDSIDELDAKIKDSKGLKERLLKKTKSSLEDKSDELKSALKKLENSSEKDFKQVQSDFKKLSKKAESSFNDLFDDLKETLEKD
ncbi:MAG: hypothetical protein RIA69_03995 [Cyclobacteriaceae bacterium]